jgi:hypothetical protein
MTKPLVISENGTFSPEKREGTRVTIFILTGSLGGGTVDFGIPDGVGGFLPITDSPIVSTGKYQVQHGTDFSPLIKVSGGIGVDLKVFSSGLS